MQATNRRQTLLRADQELTIAEGNVTIRLTAFRPAAVGGLAVGRRVRQKLAISREFLFNSGLLVYTSPPLEDQAENGWFQMWGCCNTGSEGAEHMQDSRAYSQAAVKHSLHSWDGVRRHSYVCMLYLGAVSGIFLGTHWAEHHGLPAPRVFPAMLLLFPAALVGARLLFVALHWDVFRRDPTRVWRTTDGGAALYGGLICCLLFSFPLLWVLALPFGAFWDAVAIAMLVGMIFTRVGCLLQGCCAGQPSQSCIAFELPNAQGVWCRRLPFALFEAGIAALTLAFCVYFLDRRSGGVLFLAALAMYGTGRWMLEPTREKVDRVGGWSVHRMISAVLVGLAVTSVLFSWALHSINANVTR
jgi:phosphatidylglycerol:prolipoprotein diacylglycerol transferase